MSQITTVIIKPNVVTKVIGVGSASMTTKVLGSLQPVVITRVMGAVPGPSGIHKGPTPPPDPSMLWVKTVP